MASGHAKASLGCAVFSAVAVTITLSALASLAQGHFDTWPEVGRLHLLTIAFVSLVLAMLSAVTALWLALRSDAQLGMTLVADRLELALVSSAEASAPSSEEVMGEIVPCFDRGVDVVRSLAQASHGLILVLGGVALLWARPLDLWSAVLLFLIVAILIGHAGAFPYRLHLLSRCASKVPESRAGFFRLWRRRSWPSTISDADSDGQSPRDLPSDEESAAWLPAVAVVSVAVIQIALDPPARSSGGVDSAVILAFAACLLGGGVFAFGHAFSSLPGALIALGDGPVAKSPVRRAAMTSPVQLDNGISLSDAVLLHPSRRRPVLDGINLRVEPGTVVGITGPPGSGKTALLKVILGLAGLDRGRLLFGGVEADTIGHRLRQEHVAGVLQGDRPLALTLMNNMRVFGAPDAKSAFKSAAEVGLGIEPRALPQGLSTMAGDRGAHLSTSEEQRLGLACALSSGAGILAIDDVTSAISAERMGAVFERIRKERRSLILVSSDPATLSSADVTYRIENGRISGSEASGAGS